MRLKSERWNWLTPCKTLRWPAMIDTSVRHYWPGTKRGFSVPVKLPHPEHQPPPDYGIVEIVLCNYWVVIDVLAGHLALRDGATETSVPAGQAVAISSSFFEMQDVTGGLQSCDLVAHLFSELPLKVIVRNSWLHWLFLQDRPAAPVEPGIFAIGSAERHVSLESGVNPGHPGEMLAYHHMLSGREEFIRFLLSGPVSKFKGNELLNPKRPPVSFAADIASVHAGAF